MPKKSRHHEDEFDNCRLYIGNLDYNSNVKSIRQVFDQFGEIVAIQIKNGFAFLVSIKI